MSPEKSENIKTVLQTHNTSDSSSDQLPHKAKGSQSSFETQARRLGVEFMCQLNRHTQIQYYCCYCCYVLNVTWVNILKSAPICCKTDHFLFSLRHECHD